MKMKQTKVANTTLLMKYRKGRANATNLKKTFFFYDIKPIIIAPLHMRLPSFVSSLHVPPDSIEVFFMIH